MKNLALICLMVIAITSCKNDSKTENQLATLPNEAFNTMLDNYYQDVLKLNPLNATLLGDNRYNDTLPNFLSNDYRAKAESIYTTYKNQLNDFDDDSLTENQLISKKVLAWECDINLEGFNYKTDLLPLNQFNSLHLIIGQFASGASAQPFKTVEDYNNWLKRLDDYVIWMNTAEEKMNAGIIEGYVLPKSLIEKLIPQLKDGANDTIEEHLFYDPIINFPESFTATEKEELTMIYTQMLKDKIIPAYKKLLDFTSNEYLAASRTTSGINELTNGEALYAYLIKVYTTTSMSADEIHNLGISEVARISSEMEKIKVQVGFEGDLKSFFDHVRNKKELMPYTDPQQVLNHFNEIHQRMIPQLNKLFDTKPKTPFEIRRTEAFREASASAEYNQGSVDGTRPGIFYVPIPDVTNYNIYSDESLFLHEAIPGHHYQISLQQENTDLPDFRKILWYSGYGEGWALYTESLGKELGLYTDPYQYFGMLSAEIHRAIRLVVDTGLHSKGWTREDAIQYSLDHEAESEASIIAEIERYMAIPGQALSYKIGQLKILELRAKAENKLGDKFKIGQFHYEVLKLGNVPLAVLDDHINTWITTRK
jgi:uncharacterized protein (DUF885 family)